jgi:prepilin-type N-terminal cleavage/methylation domain-containing protein
MNDGIRFQSRKGFSLIELLTVITITIILTSLCIPELSGLVRASRIDEAVTNCTSALERARQYAVANNTYTWVAFYQDTTDPTGNKVYLATLASTDGTDPTNGFTVAGPVPASDYILVSKITAFPQMAIEKAGANSWSGLPTITPAPSSLASNVVSFNLNVPPKGAVETFNQVLQFSPAGEARISSGIVSLIEMGLSPVRGANNALDTKNVAVIRLAGTTGQATLYRP